MCCLNDGPLLLETTLKTKKAAACPEVQLRLQLGGEYDRGRGQGMMGKGEKERGRDKGAAAGRTLACGDGSEQLRCAARACPHCRGRQVEVEVAE